MKIALE